MSLDCHPAALAERRRTAVAIQAIRPTSTAAASSIQSHRRLLLDEAVGVAETLEGVGDAVGDAVTVTVVGGAVVVTVTVGLAGGVTLGLVGTVVGLTVGESLGAAEPDRLAPLLIALETLLPMLLEQPAARHATSRMAAASNRLFVGRRMLLLSALLVQGRLARPVPWS
jgi:hypothetical protein